MQNLAPFEAHLFTLWGTLFHERPQRNSKKFPPGLVLDWIDGHQVWSLPSFEVSCQLLMNDLNQISSAFLLMTSSMALASTIRWVLIKLFPHDYVHSSGFVTLKILVY